MNTLLCPTFSLTTKRLILRPFILKDFKRLYSLLSDAEVMHFSPKGPLSADESYEVLFSSIESFRLRSFGLMACFLQKEIDIDNSFIGFCGVCLREVDGVLYPELGYRLFPEFWKKGYATEAACAVKDDVFSRLDLAQICSFIDPLNMKSIRVAEKIGERFAFHATYRGIEIAIYTLNKKDKV